jgi:hypothetical protein
MHFWRILMSDEKSALLNFWPSRKKLTSDLKIVDWWWRELMNFSSRGIFKNCIFQFSAKTQIPGFRHFQLRVFRISASDGIRGRFMKMEHFANLDDLKFWGSWCERANSERRWSFSNFYWRQILRSVDKIPAFREFGWFQILRVVVRARQ